MAAPKRTRSQIEHDRAAVAHMVLEGLTVRQMAIVIGKPYSGGLAVSTVQKDIEAVRREWRKSAVNDVELARAIELERLRNTEHAAWEGWEQSKMPKTVHSKRYIRCGKRLVRKVTVTKTTSGLGNPAFLITVLKCIDLRCKILGLYEQPPALSSDTGEVTMAHMIALAQNPEQYAKVTPLLSPECYTPLSESDSTVNID